MAVDAPHEGLVIHRAGWVAPVSSPPFRNGAVLVRQDRVVASGAFTDLGKVCPAGTPVVDHGSAILFPALVNAHTHLELSFLQGAMSFPFSGFPEWLRSLFSIRAGIGRNAVVEGFLRGEQLLLNSGTALCGDITNGDMIRRPCRFDADPNEGLARGPLDRGGEEARLPERQVFLELLGFNLDSLAAAMPHGVHLSPDSVSPAPVPHAAYSVSSRIIAEAKCWTRSRRLPFSIHTAEHQEEIEFLREGGGFCRELLQSLGKWDPAWTPPGKTPVEHLDALGVLDPGTILVHAVHMLDSDWAVTAANGCTVVFCPRSNRNLGTGRPNIEKALSYGIRAALGTDSLAGNGDLNLFAEAAFVLDNYPAVSPDRVIEMITVNPAAALGCRGVYGSIEPGCKANFLAFPLQTNVDESSIPEHLIRSGTEGAWKWVNPAQT